MPATWLADALRAGGCEVNETLVPDWKKRGHTDGPALDDVRGVLGHHTAGAATGDLPSFRIVRDGRPDLAGPLANLMLSRAGVWVPIAAGRAWHAGGPDRAAAWPWVPGGDGNGWLVGVEAESTGLTDDWTPAQRRAYPLGVAALLRYRKLDASRFLGHKEWAPSRKVDPAFWDLNAFRATVATHLAAPTAPEGDDMTPAESQKLSDLHAWMGAVRDGAPVGGLPRPLLVAAAVEGATAAVRSEGVSGAGDVGRIAAALTPVLVAKLSAVADNSPSGALTKTDVEDALRQVFASAAA